MDIHLIHLYLIIEEEIALGIYNEPPPEPKEKKRNKLVKSMSMKASTPLVLRVKGSRFPNTSKRLSLKNNTQVSTPKLGLSTGTMGRGQPFSRPAPPGGRKHERTSPLTKVPTQTTSPKPSKQNSNSGMFKNLSSRLRSDSKDSTSL